MSQFQLKQCRVFGPQGICVLFSLFISVLSGTGARAQQRPLDELRRLDESVNGLIKQVSPSVVQILVRAMVHSKTPTTATRAWSSRTAARHRVGIHPLSLRTDTSLRCAHVVNGAR